jgi:integrase
MLSWKILNSMPLAKYCKGTILSARVYADAKKNQCSCGGLFTKRTPHPDEPAILMPSCSDCGKRPEYYVIDADIKDANGRRTKARIRNTKDAKRLDSPTRVAYIFGVIQDEITEGVFNIRHYDSVKSKQAFIFKNYVEEYLSYHRARLERGEITPKGLYDKEGLIRREILPFFGKYELFKITPGLIKKFKDRPDFANKERTRDLSLGELKAILNRAKHDELLVMVPSFDKIPRANKREEIISRELAFETVEAIDKEVYRDMFYILTTYPIRPGELRALSWKSVDFQSGKFYINQHFSKDVLIQGRKSIKKGKEANLPFEMNQRTIEIFRKYRSASVVSLSAFVFLGMHGEPVSESNLWRAWERARKKVGHSFAPYECRHVAASEVYRRTGYDIVQTRDVCGWTSTATGERYVKNRKDSSGLFD